MQVLTATTNIARVSPYSTQPHWSIDAVGMKDVAMGKILIVINDEQDIRVITEMLANASYSVKLLEHSAEIFRILPTFEPNVILVRQSMPGISNTMTLAFIRHLTDLEALKVFVVVQDALTAKEAKSFWKADVVLTSPVSEDDLLTAISIFNDDSQ